MMSGNGPSHRAKWG